MCSSRQVVALSLLAMLGGFACRATNQQSELRESKDAEGAATQDSDEVPLPDYDPVYLDTVSDAKATILAAAFDPNSQTEGFALAGETRYFFTVYGYQGNGPFNLPKFTHTWAMFIRVHGTDLATSPIDHFVISWDAADGNIGLLQPVEPGHNYTQQQTYALAAQLPVTIRRSKIYEVSKTLYDKAVDRYKLIAVGESFGVYRYKMTDTMQARQMAKAGQLGGYTNCIHAVSDILQTASNGLLDTGTKHGYAASDAVFFWYRSSPYMVNEGSFFDPVLAPRLGI